MKESKEQIENSILIVGESLNMKEVTETLLNSVGIYSTIKELVYKMFTENKQQYFEKDDNVYESISLIRRYSKELSENGEVIFNK